MNIELRKFQAREFLQTEQDVAEFLDLAYREGGSPLFMKALELVSREVGINLISERSGLGKESLYKTLRPGKKPRFDTMVKILDSIGLTFTIQVKSKRSVESSCRSLRTIIVKPARSDMTARA
jgi:probable addiction module antidote protein